MITTYKLDSDGYVISYDGKVIDETMPTVDIKPEHFEAMLQGKLKVENGELIIADTVRPQYNVDPHLQKGE